MSAPPDTGMRFPPLQVYLSQIRKAIFSQPAPASTALPKSTSGVPWTLIMGNPSADLDSFISAVTLSYFYNAHTRPRNGEGRLYIPVLNLPNLPSSELWRMRPEFGVALRLAVYGQALKIKDGEEAARSIELGMLSELVTIADIQADEQSKLHEVFWNQKYDGMQRQQVILVDHNAPIIPGWNDEEVKKRFEVVGCIDHHVDEGYVDTSAYPGIITTGIGSCTSLVVKHLKDEGLWPIVNDKSQHNQDANPLTQAARLSLAPILIDTTKLTATGEKCSDTDKQVVAFLEPQGAEDYQRDDFFEAISKAKFESLNLLTIPEILDRDYKEWTESTKSGRQIKLGTSSVQRRLSWLIKHANGVDEFLNQMQKFAEDRDLSCLCILTMTDKRRELAFFMFDNDISSALTNFEASAAELELGSWSEDEQLPRGFEKRFGKDSCRTWWQGDINKSRKQVAPLARRAIKAT